MSTFRVVGFSGGIDSQACALWVRERFPAEEIILLNSDAGGNEHPVTEAFIRLYNDTVFPVAIVKAASSPEARLPIGRPREGSDALRLLSWLPHGDEERRGLHCGAGPRRTQQVVRCAEGRG